MNQYWKKIDWHDQGGPSKYICIRKFQLLIVARNYQRWILILVVSFYVVSLKLAETHLKLSQASKHIISSCTAIFCTTLNFHLVLP